MALVDIFLVLLSASTSPSTRGSTATAFFVSCRRPAGRDREALSASADALRRWLLGQGVTMVIVGTTVGVGLAVLGMPIAAAMGFIAGLLEFVPFFGAIAWALLGTLLAFAQGPSRRSTSRSSSSSFSSSRATS